MTDTKSKKTKAKAKDAKPREMTGAAMVIEALKDHGVEDLFGYPGGAVLPIYDEIHQQEKIRHVLVRHEQGAGHIKIFGGGGGTILPFEQEELHRYGITRIYSPDDGRTMGLQGMINDLLEQCDFPTGEKLNGELKHFKEKDATSIAKMISAAENYPKQNAQWLADLKEKVKDKIN